MQRVARLVDRTNAVRDSGPGSGRLAAGTRTPPAPGVDTELELHRASCHLEWADIAECYLAVKLAPFNRRSSTASLARYGTTRPLPPPCAGWSRVSPEARPARARASATVGITLQPPERLTAVRVMTLTFSR